MYSHISQNNIVINAVQIEENDNRAPLIPPNRFLYIDDRTIISIDDSVEARSLYKQYAALRANRYKKRCYVTGAIYTSLFINCCDIIDPIPGRKIEIDINVGNDVVSNVLITYDTNVTNDYLLALNTLGQTLNEYNDNTSRRNNHDPGKMIVIGKGKKANGLYGVYSLTNSTDAKTAATSLVKKTFGRILYWNGIFSSDKNNEG